MRPRLMTIAGPLEGQLIELTEDETTLGRDPASRIYLEDELVSRQHCSIKHSDGRFEIRDLESRNETYVNSVPIRQRELKHGDRVEMGNSIFFFFVEEEGEIPSTLTEIETVRDRGIAETRSVKGLSPEDSRYLKAPRRAAGSTEPAPSSGTLRGFEILLDISRDISVVHSLEDLEERLLLSLFDAFRAERAAILLDPLGDPDEPTFSSVFVRHREPRPGSKFRVSRTVLTTVLANRQAILSNDIPENPDLAEADSLKMGSVRSLMCAPIRDRGDIRGVLYLDTTSPSDSFDEGDLELLVGVAAICGAPLENARFREWLIEENNRFLEEALLHNIIGDSAAVRGLLERIAKCAASDRSVLIQGESGTGKELVARALRKNGRRADKPFVAINCAALVDTLVETELFGTVRGAFTGAVDRIGKLQYANGGTVFLDEIGEMKPDLQAKLLRVLEERELERVGGHESVKVDVRIVAATNTDLKKAMAEGRFREDLYYRLSVLSLTVPPLRERREDIGKLSSHFMKEASKDCDRRIVGISQEARACLAHYDWPGNIRQLKHAIEHAVDMGSTELIMKEDLPADVAQGEDGEDGLAPGYQERMREARKRIIMDAVRAANGVIAEASKFLKMHPNNVHREIAKLGLREEIDEFKRGASA